MSASDLAPFVAAVIEDGIVAEMKNKIEELESTIQDRDNERLLVQITGYTGLPIYGEKSLKHGLLDDDWSNHDRDTLWSLDMHNGDEVFIIIPLDEDSIPQLEIRVGGNLIMPRFSDQFGLFYYNFDYEEHQEEEDLDKLVYLDEVEFLPDADFDPDDDCPIDGIYGRVGPITVRHFNQLCEKHLGQFPIQDLFENIALPTTGAAAQTLTLTKIVFYKKNISGCISLMEQLGIRTSAPRRS